MALVLAGKSKSMESEVMDKLRSKGLVQLRKIRARISARRNSRIHTAMIKSIERLRDYNPKYIALRTENTPVYTLETRADRELLASPVLHQVFGKLALLLAHAARKRQKSVRAQISKCADGVKVQGGGERS